VEEIEEKLKTNIIQYYSIYACLSAHLCISLEKKNQLDATEWFIVFIMCSTCFGHLYGHHQELETILVLLCDALVAGDRRSGAGQQAMRPG